MLNLAFQRQAAAEPLLHCLRRVLDGVQPDAKLAAALSPEARAMLSELAGRLHEVQRAVGRGVTTLAALSGECREAGHSLMTVSQAQQEHGRLMQQSIHAMDGAGRAAAEQAHHQTAFIDAVFASVSELGAAVGRVGQRVAAFQDSTDESSSNVVELASALKEIGGHAGDLCAKLPDIGATAVQLGAGTRAIVEQTQEAARIAGAMQEAAQMRAGEVGSLVHDHLHVIRQTVDESLAAIQDLRDQSGAIGKIVTVIESITKQTNLLALNAAILAAQSGSEGKSFSVVADEIRVLADRTARSAKEITGVVCSVQSGADRAVDVVHRFQLHVDEGSKWSLEAADIFAELMRQAQRAADLMNGVGRAMEEHHQGVELLARSIEQMTAILQSIQRVALDHHRVAERAIELAERTRLAARQIQQAGDEQVADSRQIIHSIEPMVAQSRALHRTLAEHGASMASLQSHLQQTMDQAAQ
ncbi:MAG: methyl-accepting chemotaxis protein, partial [Nitrospirota bacterium]